MDPARERYLKGEYKIADIDGLWKARQMCNLIRSIPDKQTIKSYADIGCGQGAVMTNLVDLLVEDGLPLRKIVGYDISPFPEGLTQAHPKIEFRQGDFLEDGERFDLITLNDVLEHLSAPQDFLSKVGERARYVAMHIPLDDRWSVLLSNQYNYRIKDIGHLNFWNPSSAFNLISAAGIQPLQSKFTPGFLAPSGRGRLIQILSIPIRFMVGAISPGLAALTTGGYSLAVLGRGRLP
jgi:SAM-dependent methyltransferase